MTREEAEKILADAWIINPLTGAFQIYQGGLLDAFVALGMLKLEEQKSARERFKEKMIANGYYEGSVYVSNALDAFDECQK